ncbi:hypothetical protein [Emticicia sp. SJ17W-69]|uniref:hypothetical protein n=1 Tax=Emticicia sp. SJ17W-69 TaxID=3421657 RepID=UPI003EBD0DC3
MKLREEIIKKLENGPAVLLLGQRYLSLSSGTDVLLDKCISKFQKNNTDNEPIIGYDSFLKLGLSNGYEAASTWIEELCKNISVPVWLERIARVSWSSVYTSSIDTIIDRAFTNEWRKVQPINEDKYRIVDSRNKFKLHLTHLFGSISQIETNKRPPLTLAEKIRRKFISNILLQRLPEIITNKGILIIEGFSQNDWLSIEELYGIISFLDVEQALIFSSTNELSNNELIIDLIHSQKLIIFDISLAQFLTDLEGSGRLKLAIPDKDDYYGKYINIGHQKVKIPQELINKVSKTATIIDESLFYTIPFNTPDEKYYDFKNFLTSPTASNHWKGYPLGYTFKRDYYESLKTKVLEKSSSNKGKEVPLILYGQSSSGKSTILGLLAFELSQQSKIPVLFIEKRYQKIDELDIDTFCKWAEDNLARNTVVIWDGMVDSDLYFSLLKRLNARGRNVILVGSTYDNNKSKSNDIYIESPIVLSLHEKRRFTEYLKSIDLILSNLFSSVDDRNMLAMLYRYLPATRDSIKKGLKEEFEFFSKKLRETEPKEVGSSSSMFEALVFAGLINKNNVPFIESTTEVDGEQINLSDLLIFAIMIPGQFALNVPYELLLRTIGFNTLSSNLFKALNEVDLIIWSEDSQGNIQLGARTAIEAKILCQYLGGKKAEIEYIKLLLKQIKSYDFATFGFESNTEVQFGVELLNNISPNVNVNYKDSIFDITEVLRELRESGQAYHPRLILKEASFLRELVTDKNISLGFSNQILLERAEIIVRDALEKLQNFRERNITTYLRIELAAIIGSRAYEFVDGERHIEEAKTCYEYVKRLNSHAFASNPENYNALDILAWTTEKLIKENAFNEIEKIDAETQMIHLFEMAEIEGISEQNLERFHIRKLKLYELMGKQQLADAVFEELVLNGFTSGYFIKAKEIMGDSEINGVISLEELLKRCTNTVNYLQSIFDKIKDDGKCLFLLLNTWWTMKSKSKLFQDEKQTLPFTKNDWEYCLKLVEKLLFIGEIYQSATTLYIKALAEFHLNHIRLSLETFKTLDIESDFSSYGRRRVIKSYLASTPEGKPKLFRGEVKRTVSFIKHDKSGEIYISDLKEYIPFTLSEFKQSEFQAGDVIDNFYIGFNFRGPIAVPSKL